MSVLAEHIWGTVTDDRDTILSGLGWCVFAVRLQLLGKIDADTSTSAEDGATMKRSSERHVEFQPRHAFMFVAAITSFLLLLYFFTAYLGKLPAVVLE